MGPGTCLITKPPMLWAMNTIDIYRFPSAMDHDEGGLRGMGAYIAILAENG